MDALGKTRRSAADRVCRVKTRPTSFDTCEQLIAHWPIDPRQIHAEVFIVDDPTGSCRLGEHDLSHGRGFVGRTQARHPTLADPTTPFQRRWHLATEPDLERVLPGTYR